MEKETIKRKKDEAKAIEIGYKEGCEMKLESKETGHSC